MADHMTIYLKNGHMLLHLALTTRWLAMQAATYGHKMTITKPEELKQTTVAAKSAQNWRPMLYLSF